MLLQSLTLLQRLVRANMRGQLKHGIASLQLSASSQHVCLAVSCRCPPIAASILPWLLKG